MWKQITWTSKQTSKKLRSCWCVRRNHVPNTACFPASFVFSLLRGRKWHFASLILKRAFCLIGGAKESVDVEQKKKAIVCHADEIKPEIYFWKQTQKTFCNTENTQAKTYTGIHLHKFINSHEHLLLSPDRSMNSPVLHTLCMYSFHPVRLHIFVGFGWICHLLWERFTDSVFFSDSVTSYATWLCLCSC